MEERKVAEGACLQPEGQRNRENTSLRILSENQTSAADSGEFKDAERGARVMLHTLKGLLLDAQIRPIHREGLRFVSSPNQGCMHK